MTGPKLGSAAFVGARIGGGQFVVSTQHRALWRAQGNRVLRDASPEEVKAWRSLRTRGAKVAMSEIETVLAAQAEARAGGES